MQSTSAAFKAALDAGNETRITGTITLADTTTVSITNDIVAASTLIVDDLCVPGTDIDVGAVQSSELRVGFITDADLAGATIQINFGVDTTGAGAWEDISLGVYHVVDSPRNVNVVNVLAYDNMLLLEQAVGAAPATGTPYAYINYACTAVGVTLANTAAQINAMPNGTRVLSFDSGSEIETLRDLVMWATQLLGGFAWFNRAGALSIRKLTGASVRTIDSAIRDNTRISDATKRITRVMMTVGGALYTAAATPDDGGALLLDENPLMRTQSASDIDVALAAIATGLASLEYRPAAYEVLRGDPSLEPGDLVTLTGGVAGAGVPSLITHSNWMYRGRQTIESAGLDTSEPIGRTQEDKKVAIKADAAYITELISERIRAGKKLVVGEEGSQRAEIYLDGDNPRVDMYDPDNLRRSSWGYDGMRFFDAAGATTELVSTTTAAKTLRVGPTRAYTTIQAAIDALPKIIAHSTSILVDSGTYNETVTINGFSGGGTLQIGPASGASVTVKAFFVYACSLMSLYISSITMSGNSPSIEITGSRRVSLVSITDIVSGVFGFRILQGSDVSISSCVISNKSSAIFLENEATAAVLSTTGTGNGYSFFVSRSVLIDGSGNTIAGLMYTEDGGIVSSRLRTKDNTDVELWNGATGAWSGTAAITIAGSSAYNQFAIRPEGSVAVIYAYRTTPGGGGAVAGSAKAPSGSNFLEYIFRATVSGDTWTLVRCCVHDVTANTYTDVAVDWVRGIM